jgi:hypothetical protein
MRLHNLIAQVALSNDDLLSHDDRSRSSNRRDSVITVSFKGTSEDLTDVTSKKGAQRRAWFYGRDE